MSYEVWGDPPDDDELPEGWWNEDDVGLAQEAVQSLLNEPIYENGEMARGVSVRFLARLSLLREAVGLAKTPLEKALADDARAVLSGGTERAQD